MTSSAGSGTTCHRRAWVLRGRTTRSVPGTRIPAILIARSLTKSGVDHTTYDTLSILRTIEAQWLPAGVSLGHRDALVNDLGPAVSVGRPH